jgi:hypothetical protein
VRPCRRGVGYDDGFTDVVSTSRSTMTSVHSERERAPAATDEEDHSSSEDDIEQTLNTSAKKKRLLDTNKALEIQQSLRDLKVQEDGHVDSLQESVGTMKSKDDVVDSQRMPPATRKRKGAVHSLVADVLAQFGEIELNKDFYDSIKKTESRCEMGSQEEDVRDTDRRAFSAALGKVEEHIRRAVGDTEHLQREARAITLVSLSLDVMQFLVDMGAVSSSTATTGLTLEGDTATDDAAKSLSKSTSQNVNTSAVDEGISPLKAKKHPRRSQSTSLQEGEHERPPSRQPSLISNDPPKRQRKYEMDEVSSKPLAGLEDENTIEANEEDPEKDLKVDEKAIALDDGQDGGRREAEEKQSRSHTHASSKRNSVVELDGGNEEEKRWKSSLVCADLSLNDVGSRIYGPLLASLRAAGVLGSPDDDGNGETLESLMSTFAVASAESRDLGRTIYDVVEKVYVEDFQARNVNIAQKALALVAEAFNIIIKDHLNQ